MINTPRTIVAEEGAIPFDEFMQWALYHPETGYYNRPPSSVFGKGGDFYTASQLQPTYGMLIGSLLPESPVLELGPGGGEMSRAFGTRGYRAVTPDEELPHSWRGTVFANEFFDAVPVKVGIRHGSELRELNVRRVGSGFRWETGALLTTAQRFYVERYLPHLPEGGRFEIAERSVEIIRRIYDCLSEGTVLIVDYGWTGNEYLRFPAGTLMSYRRHIATEDVLANPGQQDITAHVPFPALIDVARCCGFDVVRFGTLAQTVLSALKGNPLCVLDDRAQAQLKTLLFGMGESFRTLWLRKSATN